MRNKMVYFFLSLVLVMSLSVGEGMADGCKGGSKGGCCPDGSKKKCSQESKKDWSKKLMVMLETLAFNGKQYDLTDSQISEIEKLYVDTKKALIRTSAEVDTVTVDIYLLLAAESVDTKLAEELLDQKYSSKKEKAKAVVMGIAQLKSIVTPEQMAALKQSMMKSSPCKEKGSDKFCPFSMRGKSSGGGSMKGSMK